MIEYLFYLKKSYEFNQLLIVYIVYLDKIGW